MAQGKSPATEQGQLQITNNSHTNQDKLIDHNNNNNNVRQRRHLEQHGVKVADEPASSTYTSNICHRASQWLWPYLLLNLRVCRRKCSSSSRSRGMFRSSKVSQRWGIAITDVPGSGSVSLTHKLGDLWHPTSRDSHSFSPRQSWYGWASFDQVGFICYVFVKVGPQGLLPQKFALRSRVVCSDLAWSCTASYNDNVTMPINAKLLKISWILFVAFLISWQAYYLDVLIKILVGWSTDWFD